ncbi:MAG TPA: rhodanese-like domain-containing protein [Gammaproteobacteria bacterium]|nr:rhodanese-like domain-containing protein [Gammaproteobacteria bacterium]
MSKNAHTEKTGNGVATITPKQAWEMVQTIPSAVLIDVRSSMEFLMIGHPKGAVHIPWVDEPDWEPNPNFVRQVRNLLLGGVICIQGECPPILLICRSGKRSLEAGEALVKAGLKNVYNIADGFEGELDDQHHRSTLAGWRHDGLPWEQC